MDCIYGEILKYLHYGGLMIEYPLDQYCILYKLEDYHMPEDQYCIWWMMPEENQGNPPTVIYCTSF